MDDLVDWGMAARVGRRVAPGGPEVSTAEARDAVAGLQESAARAVALVSVTAELQAPAVDNTAVVDRAQWIESNIAGLATVVEPLAEVLAERSGSAAARVAGAKLSGAQLGAALGWMSGKVLGQYEVFDGLGDGPRLLLVVPNIVAAERAMEVSAEDFRLWVCLHEEAHRVQFGATPWLSEFFSAEVTTFLLASDVTAAEAMKRLVVLVRTLMRILAGDEEASIVEAAQNDAQREVFERLSALMSLLEGHAEWVMDAVGPDVIPSLGDLRERLEQRRSNPGQTDGLLRRLLGMDAKLRQYSSGRAFVDDVVRRVGVTGFNRIWTSSATLPTQQEIADPAAWVARVHGRPALTP
jgi:coenzyme F420 biosynthesis associated uncharacterized protein